MLKHFCASSHSPAPVPAHPLHPLPPSRKVTSPNSWHSRREHLSPATASHSTDSRVTMAVDAGCHEEQSVMSLLLTAPNLTISPGCHFSCSLKLLRPFPKPTAVLLLGFYGSITFGVKSHLPFGPQRIPRGFVNAKPRERKNFSWSTAHVAGDLKVPSHLLIFCLWCVLQGCVGLNPSQDKMY